VKQVEDEMLRQQIEQYNETVSRYQQYQQQSQQQQHFQLHQHYQPHGQQLQQGADEEMMDVQRRRQSAEPPNVIQALLDIRTSAGVTQLSTDSPSYSSH